MPFAPIWPTSARKKSAAVEEGRLVSLGPPDASAAESTVGAAIDRLRWVAAGQVIARLDDRPLLAAVAAAQAELARHRALLGAEDVRLRLERVDAARGRDLTLQRLTVEVEQQRLDALDRETDLAVLVIELQRLDAELEQIRRTAERGAETRYTLASAELRRRAVARRIAESTESLQQARADAAAAMERLRLLADEASPELEALLEPIRMAIMIAERELARIILQMEGLVIRSPVAGMILEVHRRPGEVMRPGEAIVTIADPVARYIVAYVLETTGLNGGAVRARNGMWMERGQAVRVDRIYAAGSRQAAVGHVTEVGAHVVLIPERLQRNAARPEWGTPIRIEMPAELGAAPGELVHVVPLHRSGR